MKKFLLILSIPLIFFACNSESQNPTDEKKGPSGTPVDPSKSVENNIETLKTLEPPRTFGDSASYSMGYFDGMTLGKSPSFALEVIYYLKGFIYGYESREGFMTQKEVEEVLRVFTEEQIRLNQEKESRDKKDMAEQEFGKNPELKEFAELNLKEANKFLAQNRNRPGIKVTETGLQYEIIKEGKGSKPDFMSEVSMVVTGKLLDGKEVLNTNDLGQPMTISVSQLSEGWAEAVQLMNPGSIYRAFIHPDKAFGPMGLKNTVPPNALIIMEIELLEFRRPDIGN